MNFLPEKKYGLLSWNFVKKNVLCEKGDEITWFDGTYMIKEAALEGPTSQIGTGIQSFKGTVSWDRF